MNFIGCEKVIFKNCSINGNNTYIDFKAIGTVLFEGCTVKGFKKKFAQFENVNNIICENSQFINCGNTEEGECRSGVMYTLGDVYTIKFNNCKFQNCYIESDRTYNHCYGIVMYLVNNWALKKVQICNNEFIGCECKKGMEYYLSYFYKIDKAKLEEKNNKFHSGVSKLYYPA